MKMHSRWVLSSVGVLLLATAASASADQPDTSWRSQSLRDQPATGPNGAVAPAEALALNARMGVDRKSVGQVAPGVYSMSGWGIANGYAIDAQLNRHARRSD